MARKLLLIISILCATNSTLTNQKEPLYAPWRQKYTESKNKDDVETDACPLCAKLSENNDSQNFIVKRGKHCFVMLNLYPYHAGHLMVLPNRHVANLTDLSPEEQNELIELTAEATVLLKNGLSAQGINLGMNLGDNAGAGIPTHIHMHVIPRWKGDTGFLNTISGIGVVSIDMNDIYQKLKSQMAKQ